MHIVIYASGIPFNGDTIKERSLGGSESAAYYVAKELADRGHRVALFTETDEPGMFDGVRYLSIGEKNEKSPLGANWHFYCEHTPHEVNIVQRVPGAFHFHIQSKVNLWWAHDIALKRNDQANMAGLWGMDRMMPVSNWFKEQIHANWLTDVERITPIHNGVDYSMFEEFELKDNSKPDLRYSGGSAPITLLYSSRPERGLENLVMPGMIMEQLLEKAPHIQLKVCGYEHPVEALDGFYKTLRDQVDALPNCEHIGALTKKDLYKFMCTEADVWMYPTEFEEVSCITAMECMAAGLSIFTTKEGALPETIGDYENCVMIPNTDDGVDVDRFVERLADFDNKFRRRPRREYTWDRTATEIENIIEDSFAECTANKDAVARHYLHNSDIVALAQLGPSKVSNVVTDELALYAWQTDQKEYAKHYADGTEEMYDGPDFRYEEGFENHPRYIEVAKAIAELPDGALVYDYGCAHGHFTNNFAKQFPNITFLGIDVSPAAIKCARDKAKEWELDNVMYRQDDWLNVNSGLVYMRPDLLVAGEILEHVPDPVKFMELAQGVVGSVPVVITTPFGPWEAMSYASDHPKRFHLHHMERSDLCDLFEHHDDFSVTCLAAGHTPIGEVIGWYITLFSLDKDAPAAHSIDYERKYRETRPRQTVSFCAIVKDGQYDLPRLLKSIEPCVDEIIIGIDEATTDDTARVINDFRDDTAKTNRSPRLTVKHFKIKSAVETGFDKARNAVIKKAKCDWIMWGDADEEFVGADRMVKYLRPNSWQGYGVAQHHFSVEPTTVLSTDFPVRLFRNNPDVQFLGVVHEHPENIHKPNEGVGMAWVNSELHFSHNGYSIEAVRRGRFQRNVSLMERDRKDNPDRILGKFLWIRDLALMNRFELEQTGGMVTPIMQDRALMGLALWEDAIDENGDHPQVKRMIKDHLEFYDVLVNCMDRGFTFRMKFASGNGVDAPQLNQVPELSARFLNKRHLDKFLSVLIDDEVNSYGERYL